MGVVLLILVLAAAPTTRWVALHSADYQVRVLAGQTMTIVFPAPARLAGADRPVTFNWRIIRPVPAPNFVIFEHCTMPERCFPTVMRPTGESSGTLGTPFRVVNRSALPVDVLFRYTIWEAR
jgi:hypothetical protein